jgi:hypothetical protein
VKSAHFIGCFLLTIALGFGWRPVLADDNDGPSDQVSETPCLLNVHKILLQARGYESDTPPSQDDEKELLEKALKMIDQIPHVYHGELKAATRFIHAAVSELSNGDPDGKAKDDIFKADDEIKSIM